MKADLSIIGQNEVMLIDWDFDWLCYMRYPSIILGVNESPHPTLLDFVAKQLNVNPNYWARLWHTGKSQDGSI